MSSVTDRLNTRYVFSSFGDSLSCISFDPATPFRFYRGKFKANSRVIQGQVFPFSKLNVGTLDQPQEGLDLSKWKNVEYWVRTSRQISDVVSDLPRQRLCRSQTTYQTNGSFSGRVVRRMDERTSSDALGRRLDLMANSGRSSVRSHGELVQ